MKLLVTPAAIQFTSELAASGHHVMTWDFAAPDPQAHLVIVSGLDEIGRGAAAGVHLLAIVEPAEIADLASRPSRVADFAVTPLRPSELTARVGRICALPSLPKQQMSELMALAVESTSDVVEISTPAAVLQYVNPAYETSLGFAPVEAIGKTPAQLVRSDAHSPEFFRELDRTLQAGTPWSGTLISKARNGRMVHFDTTITPISDANARMTHHIAIKRDITDEIERRAALDASNRELEALRLDQAVSRAKHEEEIAIATHVQTSILPRLFDLPGFVVSAAMIPATQIGGDYYDLHVTPDAAWLAIGDVSGHGLDAGLVMMMMQSAMAAIVRVDPNARPCEMVGALNDVLFDNIRRRLGTREHVTFTLLRLSPDGGVTYAGAHEDILLWRAKTRRFESMPTPGVWLGARSGIGDVTIDSAFQLEHDDVVVLYTDGVIEARDAAGRQLDLDGLRGMVEKVVDQPVEAIRDHVIAGTRAWMAEQLDDISVVVLRRD